MPNPDRIIPQDGLSEPEKIVLPEGELWSGDGVEDIKITSNDTVEIAGKLIAGSGAETPDAFIWHQSGGSITITAPYIIIRATAEMRAGNGGFYGSSGQFLVKDPAPFVGIQGKSGGDGGDIQLNAKDGIVVEGGALVKAGDGGHGDDINHQPSTGLAKLSAGDSGDGGKIEFIVKSEDELTGGIKIGDGVKILGGNGPSGGRAIAVPPDTNEAAEATGGDGGDGGDVTLEAGSIEISPSARIQPGSSGDGGSAEARTTSGAAAARGGNGGNGAIAVKITRAGLEIIGHSGGAPGGWARTEGVDGLGSSRGGGPGNEADENGVAGEDFDNGAEGGWGGDGPTMPN